MPPENENKLNLDKNVRDTRKRKSSSRQVIGCCVPSNRQCFLLSSRCYFIDEIPNGWLPYPHIIKGYRVNLGWSKSFLSMFQTCHNEFYYIWTDTIPLLIYLAIVIRHVNTPKFINSDNKFKLVECGLFVGIIFCRAASTFYHIFNCVNLWTSQHLIQIDLIGICTCFCFICPYFYVIGNKTSSGDIIFDENFIRYCTVLFSLQTICTIIFVSNMAFGVSRIALVLEQPMLCLIAIWGHLGGVNLFLNSSSEFILLKIHVAVGVFALLFGYVVCFMFKYPERLFQSGYSDGKLWNSHSIW